MSNLNAIRLSLVCHACSKQFTKLKSQTYDTGKHFCSLKCRRNLPESSCKNCGKSFKLKPSRPQQSFCSMACRSAYGVFTKQCPTCGAEFKTSRSTNSSHCSNRCWTDRNDTEVDRFWSHVDKGDGSGCWLWTGTSRGFCSGSRYGSFSSCGTMVSSHRYSYTLAYGDIANGLLVCHKCDVPLCVRPDHLFLGTHSDNAVDMHAKGRAYKAIGESHPMSKITEKDVLLIRSLWKSGMRKCDIVRMVYPISKRIVSSVIKGTTWKHLL